jgi:hypothetical protein
MPHSLYVKGSSLVQGGPDVEPNEVRDTIAIIGVTIDQGSSFVTDHVIAEVPSSRYVLRGWRYSSLANPVRNGKGRAVIPLSVTCQNYQRLGQAFQGQSNGDEVPPGSQGSPELRISREVL